VSLQSEVQLIFILFPNYGKRLQTLIESHIPPLSFQLSFN